MEQRKRYTGEEKVKILREVLEDGKSVSQAAESHGVHPNLILNWRKQLFEGALKTFEVRRPDIAGKAVERKAQALEEKLREKDEVIAERAREVLALKKKHQWPDGGRAKMSLEKRQLIEGEVNRLHWLTGIPMLTLVLFAGVSGRTWREWQRRQGQDTRH